MKSTLETKLALELLSSDLQIGETTYKIPCPKCSKSSSFGITRGDQGFLYNCLRAKCGFRGFLSTVISDIGSKEYKRKKKTHVYTHKLLPLTEEQYQFFHDKYHLEKSIIDDSSAMQNERCDRIMHPVHTKNGWIIGHIGRSYSGATPKAISYIDHEAHPRLDYYVHRADDELWLVEDQLSAMRLSKYVNAAALMGVSLSEEQVADILKEFNTVYLALDNDATVLSMRHYRKYNFAFRNFYIVMLSNDVKDMNEQELRALLRAYGKEPT